MDRLDLTNDYLFFSENDETGLSRGSTVGGGLRLIKMRIYKLSAEKSQRLTAP